LLKLYGFPTMNNGCGKYRNWEPLKAIKEAGLAEVDREDDQPSAISIERAAAIFDWADVVFCQPASQLWVASILLAARDEKRKKLVVDLDDNVWAVHPMNVGAVDGKLTSLKSHFCGNWQDFWELIPVSRQEARKYKDRIDGTLVKNEKGIHFLRNKCPDMKLAVEFMIREADAVTTTNEVLANVIRKHTDKPVFVIPNCLDLRNWRKPKLADDIWIGWCGSVSHYPDLKPLMPVFDRLMEKYPKLHVQIMGSSFDYLFPPKEGVKRFPVAGYGPEDSMFYADLKDSGERWPGRMRFDAPVPVQQYEKWMCSNWQSHIAIAPLESNDFNDSKSNLKLVEYAALGIPAVASNFGPYHWQRTDIHGLRADDNSQWEEYLSELIEQPSRRQNLAWGADVSLRRNYDISKRAKDWMEVFECVVSSQVAPDLSAVT
jgi:glycosyltransferase involved in cell wall biosynthesis